MSTPAASNLKFPRQERIPSRAAISQAISNGKRYSIKGLRLHVLFVDGPMNRMAVVPVRSYRNSVIRHRARRVIREAWRLSKPILNSFGYDIVVVAYPGLETFHARAAQLRQLLRQAGLVS